MKIQEQIESASPYVIDGLAEALREAGVEEEGFGEADATATIEIAVHAFPPPRAPGQEPRGHSFAHEVRIDEGVYNAGRFAGYNSVFDRLSWPEEFVVSPLRARWVNGFVIVPAFPKGEAE